MSLPCGVLRPGQGDVGDARPGLACTVEPLAAYRLPQDRRPGQALGRTEDKTGWPTPGDEVRDRCPCQARERIALPRVPLDLGDDLVQGAVDDLLARCVGHAPPDLGQEHGSQVRV